MLTSFIKLLSQRYIFYFFWTLVVLNKLVVHNADDYFDLSAFISEFQTV